MKIKFAKGKVILEPQRPGDWRALIYTMYRSPQKGKRCLGAGPLAVQESQIRPPRLNDMGVFPLDRRGKSHWVPAKR